MWRVFPRKDVFKNLNSHHHNFIMERTILMLKYKEGNNLRIKYESLHGERSALGRIYNIVLTFLTSLWKLHQGWVLLRHPTWQVPGRWGVTHLRCNCSGERHALWSLQSHVFIWFKGMGEIHLNTSLDKSNSFYRDGTVHSQVSNLELLVYHILPYIMRAHIFGPNFQGKCLLF